MKGRATELSVGNGRKVTLERTIGKKGSRREEQNEGDDKLSTGKIGGGGRM